MLLTPCDTRVRYFDTFEQKIVFEQLQSLNSTLQTDHLIISHCSFKCIAGMHVQSHTCCSPGIYHLTNTYSEYMISPLHSDKNIHLELENIVWLQLIMINPLRPSNACQHWPLGCQHHVIITNYADISSKPLEVHFNYIWMKIQEFSFKKSAKCQTFCSVINVVNVTYSKVFSFCNILFKETWLHKHSSRICFAINHRNWLPWFIVK